MFSLSVGAQADSSSGVEEDSVECGKAANAITIETSIEERDQYFAQEMAKVVAGLEKGNGERGPKYHYKTVHYPYQYKTVGGYAGNQVSGGYKFPTGGGFWFSDSGGPAVSGSLSLSLPAPYNVVSFSVNLGRNSSSGSFVAVPTTTHYYKLYTSKVLEVRPYAVYRAKSGTQNWELDHVGCVSVVYSVTTYAKRV